MEHLCWVLLEAPRLRGQQGPCLQGIYSCGLGKVHVCTNKTTRNKKMTIKRGDGCLTGRASGTGDEKDGGLSRLGSGLGPGPGSSG